MSCIATWGYRCIWWQWVVHVHVQFSVIRYVQCFLVIFFFTAHSIWLNQKFRGNVSEAKPSAIVWLRSVVCIGTVPTTPLASCNLRREKWMMIALTNQRIVIWIYKNKRWLCFMWSMQCKLGWRISHHQNSSGLHNAFALTFKKKNAVIYKACIFHSMQNAWDRSEKI